VTAPGDPAADATGTVVRVRRRGLRALVAVEVPGPDGVSVEAELGAGEELPAGRTVGLVLPVADRAVVPPETPPSRTDAARWPIRHG
jgi:putative spermidine/putrescine transport system ATP-binding protein